MNLRELAKELNLSISAVSKALRDSHEISPATKALVIAKAKALNYEVNPFASGLRKQKTRTIALVVPEIDNNFFALAIKGIESIAQEEGYHVLIYLTHEDLNKEVGITNLLQNGRVDGIIISLSSQTLDTSHLQRLKDKNLPIVFFDRIAEDIDAPKVTTDDYESGIVATQHLINNGCKKIAFLSISNNLSISNKRKNGYYDALKNNGIEIDDSMVLDCSLDDQVNKDLISKMLKKKNRPEGIFASVEKLALDTYHICNELNINIPNDIKIIGFSNLGTADLLGPSLTTITQPAYEIGKEAASILFKIIEKKGTQISFDKKTISSFLIERDSTKKTL
jgi:LacI family transcriptional regulator